MNRKDFHFLKEYTFLDSAAGSLKPKQVIDAITDFYNNFPINPHSIDSIVGVKLMKIVKEARINVAKLLEADENEVIFTSGTTDSLNRIALMIKDKISKEDEILLSPSNHASAIVPFIEIAKAKGANIRYDLDLVKAINKKTKLIVHAQQDNAMNNNVSSKDIYTKAKKVGAFVINDAAQAITHEKVTLKYADAIAFSGNKIYGPTGIGGLVVKKELLKELKPATFGGGATADINDSTWKSKHAIGDFEAGTPHTSGIVGLNAAIKYFNKDSKKSFKAEKELAKYAHDKLKTVKGIKIYSRKGDTNILFNIGVYNAQDVVSYLGHNKIILRAGGHCAYMLKTVIKCNSSIRASVGGYNNKSDINKLVSALKKGGDFLGFI